MWPEREIYNSFLEIELSFVNKSDREIDRFHFSRAPWERETTKDEFKPQKRSQKAGDQAVEDNQDLAVVKRLKRWHKFY